MSINPRVETKEDIQLIKRYTLLPLLLDMLARDVEQMRLHQDKIVYHHVIWYLHGVEASIFLELQSMKHQLKQRGIRILKTDTNALGIDVEYKVRGYIHHFVMLRSLIKAELLTTLMNMRRR
ncbi:MAG: hypothetical protein K0R67_3821 [Paenibacillus sp.]|jgi:hypothetical protein|nr:hypothetical protein [Paenibacillus sp.]